MVRGGIGVNAPAPTPAAGVAAQLELGQVDADAWRKLLDTVPDNSLSGSASSTGGYAPNSIALRADRLLIGERQFDKLAATISEAGGSWRATLDAAQLAG